MTKPPFKIIIRSVHSMLEKVHMDSIDNIGEANVWFDTICKDSNVRLVRLEDSTGKNIKDKFYNNR